MLIIQIFIWKQWLKSTVSIKRVGAFHEPGKALINLIKWAWIKSGCRKGKNQNEAKVTFLVNVMADKIFESTVVSAMET